MSYLHHFSLATCTFVFDTTHGDADCVLFDDEYCDGEEGFKELKQGEKFMNATNDLGFDVEFVSVRKGCFLSVFTGKFFQRSVCSNVGILLLININNCNISDKTFYYNCFRKWIYWI